MFMWDKNRSIFIQIQRLLKVLMVSNYDEMPKYVVNKVLLQRRCNFSVFTARRLTPQNNCHYITKM